MGINYRKRVKLFPGVNLNISKRGVSTTIGPKGFSINTGRRGTYLNTGIPGTGLYSRQKLGSSSSSKSGQPQYDIGEEDMKTPGLSFEEWSVGLLIVGCILACVSILMLITGQEGLRFTLLFLGLLCTVPFVKSKVSKGGRVPLFSLPQSTLWIIALSAVGALLAGLGVDNYLSAPESKISTYLIVPGIVLLALAGVVKLLAAKIDSSIPSYDETDIDAETEIETDNEKTFVIPENISIVHFDTMFVETAQFVVGYQQGSTSMIQGQFGIGYNRAGRLMDQLEKTGIVGPARGAKPREVLCPDLKSLEKLLVHLHLVEGQETVTNENAQASTQAKPAKAKATKTTVKTARAANKVPADKELANLIGLDSVKEEVTKLANFVKIQQKRQEKGMKVSPISYHCVFTGNPGTGKTTVARILAEIYKDLGILSKGHLVETDRSGLVAEYVGQTAVKTNKIIDSAIGGVLFVDEAYSLVQGGNNDFGMEAISTLLKRMEDDRDKLVVVLAGYGDEMKKFIDSNPGLQSRFNRYIHFPDYSADNLYDIYCLNVKKNDYTLSDDAKEKIKALFEDAIAKKDRNFGNGRYVRNIFEKTLENQATRLTKSNEMTEEALRTIIGEDIPQQTTA